jgi:hypothetical protein
MLFSSSILNYYPPYHIKTEEIFEYPNLFWFGEISEENIPN